MRRKASGAARNSVAMRISRLACRREPCTREIGGGAERVTDHIRRVLSKRTLERRALRRWAALSACT